MAKISLILFVTVLTVPSVLMGKVSSQTKRMLPTFTATDCPGDSDVLQRKEFLKYFIGNQMPTGLFSLVDPNVLYLCQTHPPDNHKKSYYSTIFDKTKMNAILSAYFVTMEQARYKTKAKRPKSKAWKSHHTLLSREQYDALYQQATKQWNYNKGHLLPFAIYSFDKKYGKSTFDYSNGVPQRAEWNGKVWAFSEAAIKDYTEQKCAQEYKGTMYLLTGTSQFAYYLNPDPNPPWKQTEPQSRPNKIITSQTDQSSIQIPNVMWTAGCCIGSKNGQEKVESIAVIGNNILEDATMSRTVIELQIMLTDQYAKNPNPVTLFPGQPLCSKQENSYELKFKRQ